MAYLSLTGADAQRVIKELRRVFGTRAADLYEVRHQATHTDTKTNHTLVAGENYFNGLGIYSELTSPRNKQLINSLIDIINIELARRGEKKFSL